MSKTEAKRMDWDNGPPSPWVLHMLLERCEKAIVWGGNYMGLPPSSRVLVWDKENKGMHFAEAEVAWTNFETGSTRILNLGIKSTEVFGAESERRHPTQKPLALMSWCIAQAGEVETIVDPFAGSGTTGRAAKDCGKRAALIEREERYCEIAAKRMEQEVMDFGASAVLSSARGRTDTTPGFEFKESVICPVKVEEQESPLLI